MTTHYHNGEWLGKKVIVGETELRPQQPVHLLIGFHGADSTPENMLVHGNRLDLKNTVMVFPEGPVDAGERLFSWWQDGPRQKEAVRAFLKYAGAMIESAHGYLADKHPDRPVRTCLWGFSQGGAAALVYTLLGTHPIYKAASVCGFLPEYPDEERNRNSPVTVLGIFGVNDDIVPSFLAEHALEEMKNRGHQCTIKETPQAHELNAENLRDLRRFFQS
ncbi:MAG: alpha/beta hydrolase [Nitrospinaceae bacterium]